MLRRAWKPLAGATVLVGTPTALYYTYMRPPPGPATFDMAVRVRGPDGRAMLSPRTFPLLTRAGADALLRGAVHARTAPGGWRWSTASVASNAPIEDAHASAVLARADAVPGGPEGDLLFFAVMDGHGGYHTSRLLSNILIPAVALELQALAADGDVPAAPQKRSLLDSLLGRAPPAAAAPGTSPARFDADPTYVSLALQTAFARVDSELINAPIKLLAANIDEKARAAGILPDLSQHPMALATMQPALSGSCAVLALVDAAHGALYVANTGDARALAGFWDERADGSGTWRVEVLSEDQTGRNPSELARVRAEHPPAEAPYVVQRGRILGGLEPSRAFGDARYKWPRELQELLARAFLGDKPARAPPALLKTPPYVTAQPVVTHRALHARPAPDVVRSTPRFLVLATDGLWDCLSSADVGSLVAGHLSGVRGAVPTAKLAARVPLALGSAGISGKDSAAREPPTDTWAFEDEDLGAHLIRNAFGGADEPALRRLLSIPSAHSRNFRDDVTVTVVVFPTEEDAGAVKAKL